MKRILTAALLLVTCVSLAVPATAEAQLGGLIKKKVKDAIKGEKPAEPKKPDDATGSGKASESGIGGNSDVLEITQPVFDLVLKGLKMEIDRQADFRKNVLAKYPTPKQYEDCKTKTALSPEGQKIMSVLYNVPQGASADDIMKMQMKMGADMELLQKKNCPLDPNDWRDYRIHQHLDSMHAEVAEALSLEQTSSSGGFDTEAAIIRFEIAPLGDAFNFFITERQYNIAQERIRNLCGLLGSNGVKSGQPLTVPGIGKGNNWIYTGTETGVINLPNCKKYTDLTKQLMR